VTLILKFNKHISSKDTLFTKVNKDDLIKHSSLDTLDIIDILDINEYKSL